MRQLFGTIIHGKTGRELCETTAFVREPNKREWRYAPASVMQMEGSIHPVCKAICRHYITLNGFWFRVWEDVRDSGQC